MKTDRNGVPYITITFIDSETGDEITLRMNVNQAKNVGSRIVEAEKQAVKTLKQRGYTNWPTRFIMPDYPHSNETRNERT